MNYSECIIKAKDRIGKFCKACPECNGRACKNQMPGPGSKGIGDTAVRNYDKWKEIRVQMDTIAENKPVDTSLELFGKTFCYPVFAGPVGAVSLHYGDCLDDVAYNDILVSACAENGIAAFTGDGVDSNVMVAATAAIKKAGGVGIPTVKPWNLETIREKMEEFMFLGLRMMNGVSGSDFAARFGQNMWNVYGQQIRALKEEGLLEVREPRIWLTDRGIDVSNYALSYFLLS